MSIKLIRSIGICLLLCITTSSIATAAPISQTSSNILYVKQEVSGSADCSNWENACGLQDALGIASSGQEIWVAKGTYYPTLLTTVSEPRSATFRLKSGVAIYGGFSGTESLLRESNWVTNVTILSGNIGNLDTNEDNSYHVVSASEVDNTATLDGFTIQKGNAVYPYNGGGLFNQNSNPTFRNIVISENNTGSKGGGMYNENSNPSLVNVNFSKNRAYFGGGMYNINSNPSLLNVIFSGNTATGPGGGMRNEESSPSLNYVNFISNSAVSVGGGMSNSPSNPTLNQVVFSSNSASSGGGMANSGDGYNGHFQTLLTNVIFSDNKAVYTGGGIYNFNANSSTLINVSFSTNSAQSGGGIYSSKGTHTLKNITFFGNIGNLNGGGIYNYSGTHTLTNAIVWGNTPTENQITLNNTSIEVTYSDIQGSYPGTGNIDSNPFLEPLADNGGFTQTHALRTGSPAIDAANPDYCPDTDQRGYHRPINGDGNQSKICDMGAYEYGSTLEGFKLSVDAEGCGSVTIDPQQQSYYFGDTLVLTPVLPLGCGFTGWSGDAEGTETPLVLTIDGNKTITATFTQDEYTLITNVDPEDSGTITPSTDQTIFHYGDQVELTANAETGYTFTGWSGAATSTANPLSYTMLGNANITATFTQDKYTLGVTLVGSGTVTKAPDQPTYHYGDVVTLSPTANPGWTFKDWTGATVTDNKVTITGNTSLTATFTKTLFKLYLPSVLK